MRPRRKNFFLNPRDVYVHSCKAAVASARTGLCNKQRGETSENPHVPGSRPIEPVRNVQFQVMCHVCCPRRTHYYKDQHAAKYTLFKVRVDCCLYMDSENFLQNLPKGGYCAAGTSGHDIITKTDTSWLLGVLRVSGCVYGSSMRFHKPVSHRKTIKSLSTPAVGQTIRGGGGKTCTPKQSLAPPPFFSYVRIFRIYQY